MVINFREAAAAAAAEVEEKEEEKLLPSSDIKIKEEDQDDDDDATVVVKLEEESDDGGEEEEQDLEGGNDEDDASRDSSSQYSVREHDADDPVSITYQPPEPPYDKVNKLRFYQLCERLELCWVQQKRKGNAKRKKATKDQLLNCLLPPTLKAHIGDNSPYPLLRLIVPDRDSGRPHTGMKEKVIANTWGEALGLADNSEDMVKLKCYTDPDRAGANAADLSLLIQEVVKKRTLQRSSSSSQQGRKKKASGSKVTIGEMNAILDELASLKTDYFRHRRDPTRQDKSSFKGKFVRLKNARIDWVKKLIQVKQMSPLEHKWIVRILLQRMDTGIGPDTLIDHYHEWATDIYDANKNLKKLCATLADPAYIRLRFQEKEKEESMINDANRLNHSPKCPEPAVLGGTLSPMLAIKVYPNNTLLKLRERHISYLDKLEKKDPLRSSLAMKFPAFLAEIKMDGERMIIHVEKGKVKMHTRNGNWFSDSYSPVLGPPIRKALEPYDVDVILDGEIISWDNGIRQIIPFGNNRGVAKCRRDWLSKHNLIDSRDDNLHANDESQINVLSQSQAFFVQDYSQSQAFPARSYQQQQSQKEDAQPGEHCWLQYVLFDILYIGGKDASKVLEKATRFLPQEARPTSLGSILNLDISIRRLILHTLVTPQPDMVDFVQTAVIRPDGSQMDGLEYFNPSVNTFEFGYPPVVLDSVNMTLDGYIPFTDLDKSRRRGMSDNEIEQKRAKTLQSFFNDIVLRQCLEGLVFKDLCSPYGMGSKFRRNGYWLKYKTDYDGRESGEGDIDALVLGASFATGMRKSGMLSSFLVGCVDSNSGGSKYMTIGTVNGNGVKNDLMRRTLLEETGYDVDKYKSGGDCGKWFKGDKRQRTIPDFISETTFQANFSSPTKSGWKAKKDHYPDLWINPEDSFALTLFCGEIILTQDHSAGVALRFPRISRIRADCLNDGKHPSEVQTEVDLHETFNKKRDKQIETSNTSSQQLSSQPSSQLMEGLYSGYIFLTPQQSENNINKKKREATTYDLNIPNVEAQAIKSETFKGHSFHIFSGTFTLASQSFDREEANAEGWIASADLVRCEQDVINFILSHSGTITTYDEAEFIIGGRSYDARVSNHQQKVDIANALPEQIKGKPSKTQTKLLETKGVLKWTFLYRAVHRSLFEDPRRHDYLVVSKHYDERLYLKGNEALGIQLFHDTNIIEMKRSLAEAGKERKRLKLEVKHWQSETFDTLDEGTFVLQGSRQKLWSSDGQRVILYPDMTSGKVASALPLAKAMGARVSEEMSDEVTHILTEHRDHGSLTFETNTLATLISPEWIRQQW